MPTRTAVDMTSFLANLTLTTHMPPLRLMEEHILVYRLSLAVNDETTQLCSIWFRLVVTKRRV